MVIVRILKVQILFVWCLVTLHSANLSRVLECGRHCHMGQEVKDHHRGPLNSALPVNFLIII